MKLYFSIAVLTIAVMAGCKKDSTVSDVDQTAALKNVTLTCNGVDYVLMLPAGATSGKTFQQLRMEDSATYTNPANYGTDFTVKMKADNTKSDAKDAKFDGMTVNIVMDTLKSLPVSTVASGFTVAAGATQEVQAKGSLNLKTHRKSGLYIFKQVVAGSDLATTLAPVLNYKIGSLNGVIPLPPIQQNIPTRADDNTKAFLSGLINSGIFNQ